jgi:hypothetical protein
VGEGPKQSTRHCASKAAAIVARIRVTRTDSSTPLGRRPACGGFAHRASHPGLPRDRA